MALASIQLKVLLQKFRRWAHLKILKVLQTKIHFSFKFIPGDKKSLIAINFIENFTDLHEERSIRQTLK